LINSRVSNIPSSEENGEEIDPLLAAQLEAEDKVTKSLSGEEGKKKLISIDVEAWLE